MSGSSDTKTVIIVDDEVGIVDLLVDILESAGYRAIGCSVWTEAMEAIGHKSPDLVLLDLKMPTIDGPAMLEFIRKEGLDVPVIIVSGFVTDQVLEALSKLSVSAFVSKPFRTAEILDHVERALSGPTPAAKSMNALYESTTAKTAPSPAPSSDTEEVLAALQKLDGQGSGAVKAPPPAPKSDSAEPSKEDQVLAALSKHDRPGIEVSVTIPAPTPAAPSAPPPSVPAVTPPVTPETDHPNDLPGQRANEGPGDLGASPENILGRTVSVTEHKHHNRRQPSRGKKRFSKRNVLMFGTMFVICFAVAGFLAAMNWFAAQIDIDEFAKSTEKAIAKRATKDLLQQLKDRKRLP